MTNWLNDLLRRVECYQHPDRYLVVPPADTSLTDLRAVRHLYDPNADHWHIPMWLSWIESQLKQVRYFMDTGEKSKGPARPTLNFAFSPAELANQYASHRASKDHSEGLAEVVEQLLGGMSGIDAVIVERLQAGERHPDLVALSDFGNDGTAQMDAPVSPANVVDDRSWLTVGYLDRLPEDHPLRVRWGDVPYYHGDRRTPAVVLGRRFRYWLGEGYGRPKPFYFVEEANYWTTILVHRQEEQLRTRPHHELSVAEYALLKARREKVKELPKHRKFPQPAAPSLTLPERHMTWRERMEYLSKTLREPGGGFTPPTPSTPLAELLSARQAFGVQVYDENPCKEAAKRWAARYAGEARRDILAGLLLPIIPVVTNAINTARDRGQEWAAERSLNDPTEALRAQVEALTQRVGELEGRPAGKRKP